MNRKKNQISDFLFSELRSYFVIFVDELLELLLFSPLLEENKSLQSENFFFIRFSTLRIFHESRIKTEVRGGGLLVVT